MSDQLIIIAAVALVGNAAIASLLGFTFGEGFLWSLASAVLLVALWVAGILF